MTLVWFLVILCAVVVFIRIVDGRRSACRAADLSEIARTKRMNYSAIDRFQLARRLQRDSKWTSGLQVSDVLYSTHGDLRVFVATIQRRTTPDNPPSHFVIACTESLDHKNFKSLDSAVIVHGRQATLDAYRAALAEFVAV